MKINMVRLVLTILVVFVVGNLLGYFIHGIWLRADYLQTPLLYRGDGQEKFPFIVLAYLAFSIASVIVYAKGVEVGKPWWGQGLRFGILMWLILVVPAYFIDYAVHPVSAILVAKQVICEGFEKVVLGLITALLYRPKL